MKKQRYSATMTSAESAISPDAPSETSEVGVPTAKARRDSAQ